MLAAKQLAFNHGDTADAYAQGNHDDVFVASARTGEPFTKQRHSGIVLDHAWQAENLPAPGL
jgi:hypothetical protein